MKIVHLLQYIQALMFAKHQTEVVFVMCRSVELSGEMTIISKFKFTGMRVGSIMK